MGSSLDGLHLDKPAGFETAPGLAHGLLALGTEWPKSRTMLGFRVHPDLLCFWQKGGRGRVTRFELETERSYAIT